MITFDNLKDALYDSNKTLKLLSIDNSQIIFEECVKLNCFYCPSYDVRWTCPPKIPNLDYMKIFKEYENIAVILYETVVSKDNFENLRKKSTNEVHEALLFLEKFLWQQNYPLAVSFIGGGCKLCKNGCSDDKCVNKAYSRIPVEALGINVIKTLKNIDIDIIFPTDTHLLRCGMILW